MYEQSNGIREEVQTRMVMETNYGANIRVNSKPKLINFVESSETDKRRDAFLDYLATLLADIIQPEQGDDPTQNLAH